MKSSTLLRATPFALVFSFLLTLGCIPNENGRLAATSTGALLEPPATRLQMPEAPCGEAVPDDPRFERAPYLQNVGEDGASILWTSNQLDAQVEVKSLDGTAIGTFDATVDPTNYLQGATQQIARVEGLSADTVHCYVLRDTEGNVLSGPHHIRTAPDAMDAPVNLIVWGDSGGATPDQLALATQLYTVPADLMLHTGDIAYLDGTLAQLEEGYFDVYQDLLRHVPMFPTSGNHDYATDQAGPFREVFALPQEEQRYYSFDWGPLHVVALDTEIGGSEQAQWLEADLSANERPWTIVTAHKGPYSSGSHGPNGGFRSLYQPILEEHGVPLVFTGHDHHYERHEPIGGVTYVVTGGGGYSTRPVAWGQHTAFAEDVTHFVYVSVEPDRLRLHAIDATGREFDAYEIAAR